MRAATFNAHDQPAAVRASLQLAGLLLWQEYPPRWLPGREDWTVKRGGKGVATGWRLRWWDYLDHSWHEAHPGRRLVTPARGTLVVKLRHRRTSEQVAVVNGHRINGAWHRWRPFHLWRRQRWLEHRLLDRQLVGSLVEAGWTVLYGGDYNRRHPEQLVDGARRLTPRGSIDQLWIVPAAGLDVAVLCCDTHDRLGSDHALRRARVWWSR